MDEDEIKWVRINDLRSEEGADDLVNSPDMEPYLRLATTLMAGADPAPNFEEIARLPLDKRYVWRIASALKWGFADFDDLSVTADRDTLSAPDLAKVMDLLRLRPIQFCIFLKTLVGAQEMKRMMIEAISTAGRGAA